MKKKRLIRYFTIAEFEKEEAWLNQMAAKGWNLVATNGIVFTFEQGQPGEWEYKLDLPDERYSSEEISEYYRFMAGMGVEVVTSYKMWHYLRHRRAEGPMTDCDTLRAQLVIVNRAQAYAVRTTCILVQLFTLILLTGSAARWVLDAGALRDFLTNFCASFSMSGFVALTVIFVPLLRRLRRRMNDFVERVV